METPRIENVASIEVGGTDYEEYVDAVYLLLPELTVELDPDPMEFGPSRLIRKISQVRSHLDQAEMIYKQMSALLHYAQKEMRLSQTEYKLSKMDLLTNDPVVRSGRSEKERQASADMQLLEIIKNVDVYEAAVEALKTVLEVVKNTRNDLKDTNSRIKDQMKLIDTDRSIGAAWGYKDRSGNHVEGGVGFDVNESVRKNISGGEELDALLADNDNEDEELPPSPLESEMDVPSEFLEGTSSSDEVNSFLSEDINVEDPGVDSTLDEILSFLD